MYEAYRDFAVRLAREVGAIHLSYFRGADLGIRTKSNISDLVTRADRESEEHIVRAVAADYPTYAVLGEEGGDRGAVGSDYRWVVDPLDGTTNFSQGLPVFAVSIALQYRGETIVGVVYAPYLKELFTAVKGDGAWLAVGDAAPQRIAVSPKRDLAAAVVATGFPYDKCDNPDNNAENVARILPHVRDLPRAPTAVCTFSATRTAAITLWDVCCLRRAPCNGGPNSSRQGASQSFSTRWTTKARETSSFCRI